MVEKDHCHFWRFRFEIMYSVKYWKCTMKEEEKQVVQWCKEMPLGYTSAAAAVARLGTAPRKREKVSCPVVSYRCEVRCCTPEKGKSKSPSGELSLQS